MRWETADCVMNKRAAAFFFGAAVFLAAAFVGVPADRFFAVLPPKAFSQPAEYFSVVPTRVIVTIVYLISTTDGIVLTSAILLPSLGEFSF